MNIELNFKKDKLNLLNIRRKIFAENKNEQETLIQTEFSANLELQMLVIKRKRKTKELPKQKKASNYSEK